MAQYRIDSQEYLANGTTIFEAVMLADKDGNIINSAGASANINIAAGLVDGWSNISNFGTSGATSGTYTASVWGKVDTIYPWATVEAGGTLTIATELPNGSSSTLDNGSHVHVYGLDADFNPIDEEIDIVGAAGTGSTTFYRIQKAVWHDGSVTANRTEIRIKMGATDVAWIKTGYGVSSSIIYTVPAGYTAYLTQGAASCNNGGDGTGQMLVRLYNPSDDPGFMNGHIFELSGAGGQYFYPFSVPMRLPEKTDIDVRLKARQNNTIMTAAYDLILVANS